MDLKRCTLRAALTMTMAAVTGSPWAGEVKLTGE